MTHMSDVTNGASLEDCHTNFFALADLNGIKWRRLCADSLLCFDPMDDPVLVSFSRCLAAGILCVWRRVITQKSSLHHQNPLQDSNQFCYGKELWIFWYGEEPDLTGLIAPDLTEAEQGSWEGGLTYECRTFLFKALHNLIERCLLSRGFTRLGKFFVEPCNVADGVNKRTQIVFALHFFIHGDSTVCACVDARLSSPIYQLSKCHLSAAQNEQTEVQVILSPYGMAGTLTGNGYKDTDPNTMKHLNEWHHFYPNPSKKDSFKTENDLPAAVEVVVGGIRMKYPSSYVCLTESDHVAACASNKNQTSTCLNPTITAMHFSQPNSKTYAACSVLTPPVSPRETSGGIMNRTGSSGLFSLPSPGASVMYHRDSFSEMIKMSVSEECTIPQHQPEGVDEASLLWDFHDPSTIIKCSCTRCSSKSSGAVASSPNDALASNQVNHINSSVNRKSEKGEKTNFVLHSVPFHRRKQVMENTADISDSSLQINVMHGSESAIVGSGVSAAQLKNLGIGNMLGTGTPTSLPQLHTPLTRPSSVESHSNIPSVDMNYSQTCSSDPIMPTLSPHPPAVKEEDGGTPAPEIINGGYSTQSPNADIGHTINIKEKSEELLSPFHTSLLSMLENAKSPENSSPPLNQMVPTSTEDCKSNVTLNGVVDIKKNMPNLERPLLPKSMHDESENTEMVMDGSLYDYSSINVSLCEPTPSKKRRMHNTHIKRELRSEDLYSISNVNGKENTNFTSEASPSNPADPYEFTDFDESEPSERSFRSRVDVCVKEEEKVISPGLPSPPEVSSPLVQPPIGSVPPPPTENVKTPTSDPPKAPSPPTPRNVGPKFIREEDLTVTFEDLDNIFDTSSSSCDEMFPTPSTPTKASNSADDLCGKTKGTGCTAGILELTMMFPTPPSLEPNAAPSPLGTVGCSDMTALDNDVKELFDNPCASPNWEPKDLYSAIVYKQPSMQKFIGSLKYNALNNLLIQNQSVSVPPDCVYKVSWLQHSSGSDGNINLGPFVSQGSPSERQINIGQQCTYVNMEEDRVYNHTFPVDHALDQRSSLMNYELQSPVSSVPTYLNKHLNSVDSGSACSPVPEAHCLLVNLLLSDSLLNVFKDHNFDSCSLCVCNMNIKGADAGIILPNSLIPSGNDEPQYKCTCGFSAVVHRHRSYCAGLFAEDEIEVTGFSCEDSPLDKYCYSASALLKKPSFARFRSDPNCVDYVPDYIVDLIQIQSKTLCSSFSLFHKSIKYSMKNMPPVLNALEIYDGCEVCFLALETGKAALDNMMMSKMDDTLKPSCLHKWPYTINPLPGTSQEVMVHMDSLKPLFQEAVHKKNPQRLWDTTYVVSGPLTWRQFHRLAARGTVDQCEPQPIPSLMLGYDKDSLTVSPFALKYWDKLLMEPYSLPRDVAYIVVAPENDFVLSHVKTFFRELSSIYELHKLGRHSPITKVLRDGIMRVGKNAATKLADEPIDEWFGLLGDNPAFSKLKLYARVCKHRLAPHLSTLSLDKSLFEGSSSKPADKAFGVASSPAAASADAQDRAPTPKPADTENVGEATSNGTPSNSSSISPDAADDDSQQPPALVIYIVEPFTFTSVNPDTYRLTTLGLLRSYSEMLQPLPETIRNSIHLQLVSLDSVLCLGKGELNSHRKDELKSLAFSVFSQCQHQLARQSSVKSLTGFGPAASQDLFLSNKGEKVSEQIQLFNQTLILASLKDKQTELNEMFGDRREKSNILYCSYCLTEDRRWLLASCTNDKGEFIETTVINITVPNRTRRKRANVRKMGLRKLLDFILEVLSTSVHPWRIVIGRLGRLGHGELRDWASLLSRKSLMAYSRQLRELCRQCSVLAFIDSPSILSACLVSLEPDSALRIMADQYTPDDRFSSSSCHTCDLSTPEDATCTHILVFPTSAITQSSQATFREHIEPLPGGLGDDEFFEVLNEDGIAVGQEDMDDIFNWAEIPTQSPGNSPHRDCTSQAGSPGINGRHSPYQHGGPNRSMSMAGDGQEEPLQLANQPLALGYYVSTARTGPLPNWFWASCPQLANSCPVFLKSALLIHLPSVQQNDDPLHTNPHRSGHPLDSQYTTDVLRYVLEGYNTLSWLSLDPNSHDRRSCLPVHIQILMQLYCIIETLL